MVIGVLAIQGDFGLHQKMLTQIGVENIAVRTKKELERCDGLIIPGGESTTFVNLLKKNGLFEKIVEFGSKRKIMGTCAGLITLAATINNFKIETFGLIDIDVERNAYGRQRESFITTIDLNLNGEKVGFEGVFIRAPKIVRLGEGVKLLAHNNNEIVMVENENILVCTFHPELTEDTRIHKYFLSKTGTNN